MEAFILLIVAGFIIGTFGTLIGAGGGFILVPMLIIFYPDLPPETITAISMAVVAVNALSGSAAYARTGSIDYKAGILFALFTIPGSILGVYTVQYIPKVLFNIVFGIFLLAISVYLFYKNSIKTQPESKGNHAGTTTTLIDKKGNVFTYTYNRTIGIFISVIVGYISPLLGIGGGIIHVPAMVNWLRFPVTVATATSHFILAVMATVSVIVHTIDGSYDDSAVVKMVLCLGAGVVPGAQLGAHLSHRVKGRTIIRLLSLCLLLVGLRILLGSLPL